MKAGDYDAAIAAFTELANYKDSGEKATEAAYAKAQALLDSGDYEAAITAFATLGDYEDSEEKVTEAAALKLEAENAAAYANAEELLAAGDYDGAEEAFKALTDYKDSEEKATEAAALKLEAEAAAAYRKAEVLLDAGEYTAAVIAFEALGDYRDCRERASSIYSEHSIDILRGAEVGDTVLFGVYEQDAVASNGKEHIEWLVLAKEGDRILVISRYTLDCRPYNTSYTSVTWETCSLRKWLNGTFLNTAFSAEERTMIPSVTVSFDNNPNSRYSTSPGKSTEDQVFLLSIPEANRYFSSNTARQCEPTAYAKAQGCSVNSNNGFCWWWLRSPGDNSKYAANVIDVGSVSSRGTNVHDGRDAVRPALWIELGD